MTSLQVTTASSNDSRDETRRQFSKGEHKHRVRCPSFEKPAYSVLMRMRCDKILEGAASPKAQDLATKARIDARQPSKDLAAERINVGTDIVGEERPISIVDDVYANESTR